MSYTFQTVEVRPVSTLSEKQLSNVKAMYKWDKLSEREQEIAINMYSKFNLETEMYCKVFEYEVNEEFLKECKDPSYWDMNYLHMHNIHKYVIKLTNLLTKGCI